MKGSTMKVSARNVFKGKITALVNGAVNAEVELTTAGGDRIVAIVTEGSVKSLDLAVSKEAIAYVKAPWVMLLTGAPTVRFFRSESTGWQGQDARQGRDQFGSRHRIGGRDGGLFRDYERGGS